MTAPDARKRAEESLAEARRVLKWLEHTTGRRVRKADLSGPLGKLSDATEDLLAATAPAPAAASEEVRKAAERVISERDELSIEEEHRNRPFWAALDRLLAALAARGGGK